MAAGLDRPSFIVLLPLLGCSALPLSDSSCPPLIVAHRGSSHEAPENTLVAYELAIEQGARLAECDIYLSSDGVPVLFHDKELKRTSNGEGKVESKTLAELNKLDAGSWKHEKFAGETIPTLVEFLEAVKGKLRPVLEIKGKGRGIEKSVVDALKKARVIPQDVMIFSFHHEVVAEIVRLEPRLPATWLIDKAPENDTALRTLLDRALASRLNALGISHENVSEAFVREAKERGFPVFVWTVNDAPTMRRLVSLGVDAIITDRPALAFEVLGRR